MGNFLKKILFHIILVLIVLHVCIPHPHLLELTEEKHFELHKNSNSLIGIIRLAFHESDDENLDNLIFSQFESIREVDSKHKYSKTATFYYTIYIVRKRSFKNIIKSQTDNFNRLLFVILNGLRGPPPNNLIT